jgi:hypothetical protein
MFSHEHERAAEYFRFAVSLDEQRAYSHHYLAFNLDWLARESPTVEQSYLRAIELQPTHPWWWSRWISYLATARRVSAGAPRSGNERDASAWANRPRIGVISASLGGSMAVALGAARFCPGGPARDPARTSRRVT